MTALLQRAKGSLKYRSFFGYCRTLEKVKKHRLTRLDWPDQFQRNLPPLLAVTRQSDIPLLLHSLRSLRKTQSAVPQLWLVGDSDEAVDTLKKLQVGTPRCGVPARKAGGTNVPEIGIDTAASALSVGTLPSSILSPLGGESCKISHWKDFLADLTPSEKKFVETWEKSKPWGGYAKKFAATVAANRSSALLLSDADVLWKREFLSALQQRLARGASVLAGVDFAYSYDREVAAALKADIFSAPPLNCGFMYYSRGILSLGEADYAIVQPFAANATTHLEQTLIAHAFQKAGGQYFATEEVAATLADDFCLKEKVSASVRHYAGAKHLFWRDA